MGVAIPPHTLSTMQSNFHFKWVDSALKYLGTYIPSDLSRTYDLNFPPLLAKTRILLENWHKGIHSWFGRYNLIKMCTYQSTCICSRLCLYRYHSLFLRAYKTFSPALPGCTKNPTFFRLKYPYQNKMGGWHYQIFGNITRPSTWAEYLISGAMQYPNSGYKQNKLKPKYY